MQSIKTGARLPFLHHHHQQHHRTMSVKSTCTPGRQVLVMPTLHNQHVPPGFAKGAGNPLYSAAFLTSFSIPAASSLSSPREPCPGKTRTFLYPLDVFILFFRPHYLLLTRPNCLGLAIRLETSASSSDVLFSTGGGHSSEFLNKYE